MVKPVAVKRIMVATVFVFFTEAAADFNVVTASYRNITAVREAVDIAPEQKPVIHFMGAAISIRLDVGGLKSR